MKTSEILWGTQQDVMDAMEKAANHHGGAGTMIKTFDKLLRKIGLMRISQVPRFEVSRDGHIKVTFKNGFRWSGQQDLNHLKKMMFTKDDDDEVTTTPSVR